MGGRSSSLLSRSTSVRGIDLKRSMLERHGWSAPWLPGHWKLPNGDLFDVQASQTSLLISLQLYFEKGLFCTLLTVDDMHNASSVLQSYLPGSA